MTTTSWLNENTYHHSRFDDIERLVELKREKDQEINVIFPTLNEEDTIGKEIILVQQELMIKHPLVDDIAVIDSGSEDRTREIAEKFGASVYLASEQLEEEGVYYGKGENLWKALYVLEGDIMVYIDADIKNIAPKFVYGLVGPLLERDQLGYVKAFYERPIEREGEVRSSGGGRVTEILVRPLFNLCFPELAGMIQPLSGEYAGRREILEQLPFFIGYGVETGLLIDIQEQFGMRKIAQVDLDKRVHKNQDLPALSRMSFGILQTFFNRVQSARKMEILEELSPKYRRIMSHEDRHELDETEIHEMERPPMIEVDRYREKFGKEKDPSIIES